MFVFFKTVVVNNVWCLFICSVLSYGLFPILAILMQHFKILDVVFMLDFLLTNILSVYYLASSFEKSH